MPGFHHIEIVHAHQKFLTFQLCVLPFGLSSPPFVVTKIFKALLKSRRSRGIPIVIFLDEGLGVEADPGSGQINSLVVHFDLWKSGCVLNEDTSQWEPIQIITWHHCNWCENCWESLSHDSETLSTYEHPTRVHAEYVASIAGQIISFSSSLGPVARVMTRFLFSDINSAVSWDGGVLLTQDAISTP